MDDKSKSVMRDGHFVLSGNKEPSPSTSILTSSMLSMSGKDLINKGIKVPTGESFYYSQPKEYSSIYIFEAGFRPGHSETVKEDVYVYITCNKNKKSFLVGTLSSQHPRIRLNLVMAENFQLRHTSQRRAIFFNAWQFSHVPLYDALLHGYAKKEFWVREVKPLKGTIVDPIAEKKKYHILKVLSGTNIEESIDINVQFHNKTQKIGILSSEEPSLSCDLEYDEEFTLSHTSKAANVLVSGYAVPYFSLKELPGPPSPPREEPNLKPVKECADPECEAFVEIRQKRKATA